MEGAGMAIEVGQAIPSFTVRSTNGEHVSTHDLTGGGITVFAFVHFAFSGG
jgi:peroxiredoxin